MFSRKQDISQDVAFSERGFKQRLSEQEAGFCLFVSEWTEWQLLADVSGPPIGHILKVQESSWIVDH